MKYGYVVLGSYMIVAAISQLIWLNFASITTPIMTSLFKVTAEDVGLLSAFWPLIFIPLSIPAGILTDKKGFKFAVSIGALFIAIFSTLRIFAGDNFYLLLSFQTLAGIGQPFIYTTISKMVMQWFDLKERGLATGLAIMAQFIGFILALVLTPIMVPEANFDEYQRMLIIYSVISITGFFIFLALTKERKSNYDERVSINFKVFKNLMRSKDFILLNTLFFIGVGYFTGILTWIESILVSRGISISISSLIAGVIIIGGIIGSIVIPAISDKIARRKPFFIINLGISALMLLFLSFFNFLTILFISSFLLGFFLVSSLPIALDYSSDLVSKTITGTMQSILWLFSQAGSVVIISVMGYMANFQLFPSNPYLPSMIFVIVLDLLAFFLCFFLKEIRPYKHG